MVKIAVLFLGLLLNLVIAAFAPNMASSIIATLMYVVFVMVAFGLDKTATWLMLPFIMGQLSVLVSLNVIESGGYMVEMGQAGHPAAASASFAVYSVIMLASALLVRRALRDRRSARFALQGQQSVSHWQPLHPLFEVAFLGLIVLIILYLFVAGFRTGFPLLTGMDRFVYRRNYADILTLNLLNLKILPPMGLGILLARARSRGRAAVYVAAFLALTAESFLFGDKFFIMITSVISFVTPYVVHNPELVMRKIRKLLPFFGIGMAVIFVVTLSIYAGLRGGSGGSATQRLGDRVSSQGELWFMATEDSPSFITFDAKAIKENIASILQTDPAAFVFRNSLAPFYFVTKFSPPKMYRSVLHNNGTVSPTMAFEAYGLVLVGYGGLIILVLFSGCFIALLVDYTNRVIKEGNPFTVLLPAFLMSQAEKSFSQGTLYSLVSIPTMKQLVAFVVMVVIVRLFARSLPPSRDLGAAGLPARGG